jgi:hypothetical protein
VKEKTHTAAAVLALVTCLASFAHSASQSKKQPKPVGKPAAPQVEEIVGGGEGKVLETMDSGGYTYLKVSLMGKPTWVATAPTSVKKGATVIVPAGLVMHNFRSDSLKRDFDVIYFVNQVTVKGAKAPEAQAQQEPAHPAAEKAAVKVTGVPRAEGGKTVEEILRGSKELDAKEIAVRAQVVKRNLGIMGKTWLHVQDGTGAQGADDLMVTTDSEPEVGDVLLIKGKVGLNKDFGFGYRYDVIVEDAKVTKE